MGNAGKDHPMNGVKNNEGVNQEKKINEEN